MRSWPAVAVPRLLGPPGPELRVHDTAAGSAVTLDPAVEARMYVCGITPYDATHLGHAATYLAFDVLQRVWRDRGTEVRYAQNVTDIDDPLLERATRDGVDWAELAEQETQRFREDMAALRVLPPDTYTGAVEAIPQIAESVRGLLDSGAAYRLDGDVYLAVGAAPAFGDVAGLDAATMTALSAERGGDPDRPGKKDPLDSLLWRAERRGEPSWPSPLGPGRPGWHVECAVIALDALGTGIDVQGGGSDLAYPHHEHSAATGELLSGTGPFARAYVHAGMVGLDGEKMSKSRGNLVFVSRLRTEGVDPMALRLALLADHYRSDRAWTPAVLAAGEQRLARWRAALAEPAPAAPLVAALRDRLADDLDTPGALRAVDEWSAGAGGGPADAELAADAVDALLGVLLRPAGA